MEEKLPPNGRRRLRRAWQAAGLIVVGLLLWWLWHGWDSRALMEWKERIPPWAFFALMAILPALGFPTTPLYLVAGAAFGTVTGVVGTLAATGGNLALTYWIANSGLRPLLLRWLAGAGLRPPELDQGREWRLIVLVKLTPGVPSFLKNYLLGLAGVPFAPYWAISFVIAGSYATALVVLGESFLEHDPGQAVYALLALAALAAAVVWWRRRHSREAKSRKVPSPPEEPGGS